MMVRGPLLCLIGLCSCTAVVGLSDLSFEASTTGVPAGGTAGAAAAGGDAGGTGGAAGGGGSLPTNQPADWTASFDSVWLFELASPQLGKDSGPQGIDLTEVGLPQRDTQDMVQGVSSLRLLSTDSLVSNADLLNVGPTEAFTLGGWFKTSMTTSAELMGRKSGAGYLVEYLGDTQSAKCFWEDDATIYLASVAEYSWLPNQWTHFVCRWDPAGGGELTPFIHGVAGSAQSASLAQSAAPFTIGGSAFPFDGLADEAFFVRKSLSNAAIARIHACGISGHGCTCKASDPSQYENCGNADPNCGVLPACNWPTP